MINRTLTITIDGNDYLGELGRIRRTTLGVEDHGIFTFWGHWEAAGSGQGFGGYALDEYDAEVTKKRQPTAYGMRFVQAVMAVVGVREYESVAGSQVIVLRTEPYGNIVGLAHPTDTQNVLLFNQIEKG